MQKGHDRIDKQIYPDIQDGSNHKNQSERMEDSSFQTLCISLSLVNGKQRPRSHGQAQKNGGEERH